MKKTFAILFMLLSVFRVYTAEMKDKESSLITGEMEGRAKLGITLGYPMGVVFGYDFAESTEVNALVGTRFNDLILGLNMLFTLVDIKIDGESFPLSLGPAVYLELSTTFDMAVLAILRWEYTFKNIPLNLYVEGGPGLAFIQDMQFRWTSAVAVRYVF